jgi:hypothetical protein
VTFASRPSVINPGNTLRFRFFLAGGAVAFLSGSVTDFSWLACLGIPYWFYPSTCLQRQAGKY